MARLRDIRERVHQPQYDTLVRGIGVSSVTNLFQLFGNANIGDRARTNLQVPGQLAADATYVLKAVRCVMWFQGLNDSEFTAVYNAAITPLAGVVASNSRAEDLYMLMAYGANFTLNVGQKTMLQGPLWYVPAGGGITGFTTENARHVLSNGTASQEAILKLARDIPIATRQNFSIAVEFFPFARIGTGVGAGGVNIGADIDVLLYLNQFDGAKLIQFHLDGIVTRDVQ
jgi:hypothetical protein